MPVEVEGFESNLEISFEVNSLEFELEDSFGEFLG
jgi:hypothetical protein